MPTPTPSTYLLNSTNFDRLMSDMLERVPAAVTEALNRFRTEGKFAVTDAQLARALAIFSGHRVDEAATMATIADVWKGSLYLLDPHTAVGIGAAKAAVAAGRVDPSVPMVVLATAHPAKFPDAVEKATGRRPDLPPRLSDLYVREERLSELPNDLAAVQDFVIARARAAQEAA